MQAHHALALTAILYTIATDTYPRSMTLGFAGLASEATGDLLYLLTQHGQAGTPAWHRLMVANLALYTPTRVGTIAGGAWLIVRALPHEAPLTRGQVAVCATILSLYSLYCLRYIVTNVQKLRSWRRQQRALAASKAAAPPAAAAVQAQAHKPAAPAVKEQLLATPREQRYQGSPWVTQRARASMVGSCAAQCLPASLPYTAMLSSSSAPLSLAVGPGR